MSASNNLEAAANAVVEDMANGAEAYLQLWERATTW